MSQQIIVRAGSDRIEDLRELWESLSDHHVEVAPELGGLGPPRTSEESWEIRRALYKEWLSEPEAFALIAQRDETEIGYAVVHMREPEESWQTGTIAVLETLTVLPGWRGQGVGTNLVRRIFEELRRLGVGHIEVTAIASNMAAQRFYERLGLLRFAVTYLGRVPD